MPTDDFRRAALPLFAEGLVESLEWSVDVRYGGGIPSWFAGLLDHYGQADRLYAHGVHYSMLTAAELPHHEDWLQVVGDESRRRGYRHFSEHFGFMVADGFDRGAPMSMPMTDEALAVGISRLQRLHEVVGVPVGLENLAFAFGPEDLKTQPRFVEALIEPVDGFVLLDLHNLWCQAVNYDLDPIALFDTWPAARIRELHLSGGSWTELPTGGRFRRDTHDDAVPEPVFELLDHAVKTLPNLEVVVLERMGGTMRTPEDEAGLRTDFRRILEAVHG